MSPFYFPNGSVLLYKVLSNAHNVQSANIQTGVGLGPWTDPGFWDGGVLNCVTESKIDHTYLNPAHSFHLKCATFNNFVYDLYCMQNHVRKKFMKRFLTTCITDTLEVVGEVK